METSANVYATAIWTVKPGKETEFAVAWQRFADWTVENQPGATKLTIFQDMDDEHLFVGSGPWADAEGIKAWRATPQVVEFMAVAREICDDVRLLTLRPVATARREKMAA